jgi:peptide/nickel transport system substrate-binding protein
LPSARVAKSGYSEKEYQLSKQSSGGATRRDVIRAGGGLAAALALVGATPARAAADNLVRHAVSADHVNSLDPSIVIQNADANPSRQMFDSLIDPPYGTFNLNPPDMVKEAAESWEISKDARTYTVKLQEGMQFHKGYGEVTSEDVKFTYDRLGDPKGSSSYRVFYAAVDEVKIIDKYRFQITLKGPDPTFYATSMLSRGAGIVCKKAVEKLGNEFRRQPIGSGPFEFVAIDPNRGVILKRFEQYHRDKAKLDGLEYRYMSDPSARTLGFLKGELDMIEGARLPGWNDDLKRQMPSVALDLTRPGSTNVVFFNMTRKPFDDIRVRKALRYAIDRNVFHQAFGDMYGDVWGINPPQYPGAFTRDTLPAELRYDYDPAKARQLLAEAGFPNGFAFDNQISQREDYSSLMLMIQQMLRKVGITMRLQTIDHTTYHNNSAKDMVMLPLNSETTAPVGTLLLQRDFAQGAVVTPEGTGGRVNMSHYGQAIPGIDDLLDKMVNEADPERRMALTREAELKVLQDMPAWNAMQLSFVTARNPRVNLGYEIKASYANFSMWKATTSV